MVDKKEQIKKGGDAAVPENEVDKANTIRNSQARLRALRKRSTSDQFLQLSAKEQLDLKIQIQNEERILHGLGATEEVVQD